MSEPLSERRLDRIEDVIEKLTEISADLNKMIAVQEQKRYNENVNESHSPIANTVSDNVPIIKSIIVTPKFGSQTAIVESNQKLVGRKLLDAGLPPASSASFSGHMTRIGVSPKPGGNESPLFSSPDQKHFGVKMNEAFSPLNGDCLLLDAWSLFLWHHILYKPILLSLHVITTQRRLKS